MSRVERIRLVNQMNMNETTPSQRAEFDSLADYLGPLALLPYSHVAYLSFNHWQFAIDVLTNPAVTTSELGSTVTVGFGAHELPMRDIAWAIDRLMSKIFRSQGIDSVAQSPPTSREIALMDEPDFHKSHTNCRCSFGNPGRPFSPPNTSKRINLTEVLH